MDEAVIKFYRKLLRSDFEHVGSLENPTIFLDSVGEKVQICSQAGNNYIHLYIVIRDGMLEDVKYVCTCDPTSNVAIEILCTLLLGQPIKRAKAITEADFSQVLGSQSEDLNKRAKGLLELLHNGLSRYKASAGVSGN